MGASMDNYFNTNSHFNVVDGSPDKEFVDTYNNNIATAAIQLDSNIAHNTNIIYPPQPSPKNAYEQKADHNTNDDVYFHQYESPKRSAA